MTKSMRKKVAYLLKFASLIVVWQISFPSNAVAAERTAVEEPMVLALNQQTDAPAALLSLPVSPDKPRVEAKRTVYLNITAYSSTRDQTDGDPFTTASGSQVRDGVIAANFLSIGTRVRIPEYYGDKVFIVEDRMNPRHRYMADIWMPTREQAKEWGVHYTKLEIL